LYKPGRAYRWLEQIGHDEDGQFPNFQLSRQIRANRANRARFAPIAPPNKVAIISFCCFVPSALACAMFDKQPLFGQLLKGALECALG
jgi:hypothetical protein